MLNKEVVRKGLRMELLLYKEDRRHIDAKEKEKVGISTGEGRKHSPFVGFRLLANIHFKSNHPEHVYVHAFLILDWNRD